MPLALFAFCIAANIFDAWATLRLIGQGANEANPYVQMVLSLGLRNFWIWKIGLITFCLLLLTLAARNHRRARIALLLVSLFFAGLTGMHL